MAKKMLVKDLLFVSKSPKETLDYLAAGASLVARTGADIKRLRFKAASDRLALAASFLKEANALSKGGGLRRTVVSRAYYAMYHAARAATFISFGGDDHEQHTVLPSKLPLDFPDSKKYQNSLKSARFERNRADYDPYPRSDEDFSGAAATLLADAVLIVSTARKYIRAKSS
ncbi:HEPN domain-containing protein [Xanthomonas graminis]|uniref:HEPN domain-containing protein n=1 Tax=Xanthomonas graminis TaxID=3390026 RepID=UPI0018C86188|nr:HEPN domain-containing protein [Xanthomonas translucens]UKE77473.1 HEPN domain-containing protein [Xanthomonas translucens pv. arrhenatheri]